jgi:hypothetical protein
LLRHLSNRLERVMNYQDLAFAIGFLLATSALVTWLAMDADTETAPESPTSLYERLQKAGRN